MEHKFQVNLAGIIDLLSTHTHSTPDVSVRELLQKGVDAILDGALPLRLISYAVGGPTWHKAIA